MIPVSTYALWSREIEKYGMHRKKREIVYSRSANYTPVLRVVIIRGSRTQNSPISGNHVRVTQAMLISGI